MIAIVLKKPTEIKKDDKSFFTMMTSEGNIFIGNDEKDDFQKGDTVYIHTHEYTKRDSDEKRTVRVAIKITLG